MNGKNDDITLFKYGIIVPLINNNHGFRTQKEYIDFVVQEEHKVKGKIYKLTSSNVYKWLNTYRKYGIKGLEIKTRCDYKKSRKLNPTIINRIISLREEYPHITGTAIYAKLIEEQLIEKKSVSLNTLLRFIKNNNLKANQVTNIERRMFEMEYANDCWQADTSSGPYIKINNIKYKTYIIMFIDDKSRMVMGFGIYFNDNAVNMQSVFKEAVKTYGKPKKLFVDNGGPYDNKQLSYICASLGVELIHAKPYSPESKAKQERLFRTIKDGWMRCTDWNTFTTLEDIKKSLELFLINNYINKIHSVTKEPPLDRWHKDYKYITFLEEEQINEAFLHKTFKTVRLDRTIKFNNEYYEIPFKYVGQKIELRYNPSDLDKLYLYENSTKICEVSKVDKIANGKSKRHNGIDYSKMINDERDTVEMGVE